MRLNLIPLETLQSDPLMSRDGKALSKPTFYRGKFYRTLNEARWAYAFDAMSLQAAYEDDRIRLASGRATIPDFYLPQLESHLEVGPYKSTRGDDKDIKCRALAQAPLANRCCWLEDFPPLVSGKPPFLTFLEVYRPDGEVGWSPELAAEFPMLDEFLHLESYELNCLLSSVSSIKFERFGRSGQPAAGVSRKFWEIVDGQLAPVHRLSELALKLLAMRHCGFRGGWPSSVAKALRCDAKEAAAALRELREHGFD